MPIPLALAAILAAGGSALAYGSSQRTNDTNRALARETNAFNAQQSQLNRDFQMQMLQEQAFYNSPKYMMGQYKQAGLSPYAYLSSSGPQGVGLASAPANIPSQAPQMMNPFDYSNAQSLTQMMSTLADTDSKTIQNTFLAEMLTQTLKKLGIENQMGEVSLEVQQATKQAQIDYTNAQAEREKFETYLRKTYGEDMTDWQLQNLMSRVYLMEQQGITEGTKRALDEAMTKAHLKGIDQRDLELQIQKYVAHSQAIVANSTAKLQSMQAEQYGILNEIGRKFGIYDKALDLANKWQEIGNTYQKSKYFQELIKSVKIKNKWMNYQEAADVANKVLNCVSTIVSIASSLTSLGAGGAGAASGGYSAPNMISTLPMIPM